MEIVHNKRLGLIYTGIFFLSILTLLPFETFSATPALKGELKPFRVILVIGDQWDDPAGYMVNLPQPGGLYSGYDARPDTWEKIW